MVPENGAVAVPGQSDQAPSQEPKKKAPVRHAEKRRTASCRFANRVAALAVQHYREKVPASFRSTQKQTCLAAVVAHERFPTCTTPGGGGDEASKETGDTAETPPCDALTVVGLGVGTKFLTEAVLASWSGGSAGDQYSYGDTVRDCHAEVLARRAFRRHVSLELKRLASPRPLDGSNPPTSAIFECVPSVPSSSLQPQTPRFRLKPNVTLHFYSSSAPCGNACLKKFATLQGERFREDLSADKWLPDVHEHMPGHSLRQGQFALTVKKDSTVATSATYADYILERGDDKPNSHKRSRVESESIGPSSSVTTTQKKPGKKSPVFWPANTSDAWCPAGTTTVWSGKGSLHTCSAKILRWNNLGLQGSLLAATLAEPLYLASITVGRKLTPVVCRRALCCRAGRAGGNCSTDSKDDSSPFRLHHPAIMGTSVYMDDTGVIDMSNTTETGQDVRFHSTLSFAWWPTLPVAECIDGSTGWAIAPNADSTTNTNDDTYDNGHRTRSEVSTASLLEAFLEIERAIHATAGVRMTVDAKRTVKTLSELRAFKRQVSSVYENSKEELLTKHPVLRQWRRRERDHYR